MSKLSETNRVVRKFRKKLREIERLELSDRSVLNPEEIAKIKKKETIRAELSQLLLDQNQDLENGFTEKYSKPLTFSESVHISPDSCVEQNKSNSKQDKNQPALNIPNKAENLPSSPPDSQTLLSNHPTEMKRTKPQESPICDTELVKQSNSKKCKPEFTSSTPLQQPNPTQTEKKDSQNRISEIPQEKPWHETLFIFNYMDAHSDLICCVDLDDDYVISGSRDTLVQVWCAKTASRLVSLRGHTNTVTCVSLITAKHSKELYCHLVEDSDQDITPRLALSSSVDCYLKIWSIEDGRALRSIYTFSSITALCYLPSLQYCVVGSEGGKLEVYSLIAEHVHPIASHHAFEGPVSSIQVQTENFVCTSLDGSIDVYALRGSGLCRLYHSEDLISETGHAIRRRPILTSVVASSVNLESPIYFGDEGPSIKVLSWKTGRIQKIRNHPHEFGQTNCLVTTKSFLFSSSINVDTGNSSVNVFSQPDLKYLGTLSVNQLGRIVSLSAIEDEESKNLKVVVGGTRLTLIETKIVGCKRSAQKDMTIIPKFIKQLTIDVADSAEESSESSEEEDDQKHDLESSAELTVKNQNSWCSIL